jgi:hypothetical protein
MAWECGSSILSIKPTNAAMLHTRNKPASSKVHLSSKRLPRDDNQIVESSMPDPVISCFIFLREVTRSNVFDQPIDASCS